MTGFLLVVMVLDAPTKDPVFSFNILLFVAHLARFGLYNLKISLRLSENCFLFITRNCKKALLRGLFQ